MPETLGYSHIKESTNRAKRTRERLIKLSANKIHPHRSEPALNRLLYTVYSSFQSSFIHKKTKKISPEIQGRQ